MLGAFPRSLRGRGAEPRGAIRREWLVLAGVLVPFTLLLVAGFWLTREAPSPALTPSVAPTLPPLPLAVAEAPDPHVATAQPAVAEAPVAVPADAAVPEAELDTPPPGLEAAFTALRPALRQCLADAAHPPPRVTLRVTFRARSDGRFDGYRLESRDWQDPYFEACVEDVFDEVSYAPTGREPPGAVTHAFLLGPR